MLKPLKWNKNGEVEKEVRISPPAILYRAGSVMEEVELQAAEKYFVVYKSRMSAHGGELVIPRYSCLPFYKELEDDLAHKGVKLINSYRQHRYIADLQNYVQDLGDLTFQTWNFRDLGSIPDNISLVLKGETNSRKDKWNTHMFAKNKQEAIQVYLKLQEDSLIAQQEIYLREFVPLVKLADGIGGHPVSLEFRIFVCYGQIISQGFYWSSFVDELCSQGKEIPNPDMIPRDFLQKVIDKVKDNVNFFVIDVAKTESGNWIVVELNDGSCSGLSENNPNILYKNLKYMTWDKHYVNK